MMPTLENASKMPTHNNVTCVTSVEFCNWEQRNMNANNLFVVSHNPITFFWTPAVRNLSGKVDKRKKHLKKKKKKKNKRRNSKRRQVRGSSIDLSAHSQA
eukprot:TRINITY_DN2561_c2_g1_i2.p2 TRINITY_DN2561_c2_g1~~TRINITY_DN2561_c2_g1_i2.p2  ORF type:complete len:100 (-),score=18.21 TRINITY_DN2561_c2_g1_i2:614-913(-)